MVTRARATIAGLVAGPAALAVAGAAANGLNLVMNLVLARVLDPSAYGAVVVQVSIFMVLSVGGNALLIAVVQKETAADGDSRREQWAWIRRLRRRCLVGVLIAAVVAMVVCRPAAMLLSYAHPLAVAEAVIGAAVWTLLCVERGVLQARGAYQRLAANFIVEAAIRVSLIVVFVVAGLGVNGAGLGLVLGTALATDHARKGLAKVPRALPVSRRAASTATLASTGPLTIRQAQVVRRAGLLASTWVALGALIPLALLQNMDVVIVGWLNHDGAGEYAAIATACKVPVFIGLAVANFLLPEAARRRAEGHGAAAALGVALALVVAPGLALAAAGAVAAEPLLSLVFGSELAGASSALSILALGMTCLAVTLMFATYLLGAAQQRVVVVLAVCACGSAAAIGGAGGDAMRTAVMVLASQAVTAVALGVVVYLVHRADARGSAPATGTPAPSPTPAAAGTVPPSATGRPASPPAVGRAQAAGARDGAGGTRPEQAPPGGGAGGVRPAGVW
ncbi:polysaccharide biosynthesis protein [Parafrankia colletiae]|uniref:Polysaccharide biosynthesis protein n=1 Tax=Parafrankia colletiae TaxID=573497 RepID=A0A1S1QV11_9ACTN|nr:polysaccharide biosynthesis protein [Parafrankia colletiae]MCK9904130.1 polysaccharide biosynthesis protein [Frankia sp. Cpl3]OHV36892.1 polysaccharide biosynthesis protein [Parafrankia colletiae]